MPSPNEIYQNNGFTIRVIDGWTDKANKNADGTLKKTPNDGGVLYEYQSEPVGKIGQCIGVDGFERLWGSSAM